MDILKVLVPIIYGVEGSPQTTLIDVHPITSMLFKPDRVDPLGIM